MIIFINGSINAGKSTIAKLLTEKLPNTVNIEVDCLRDFISWMPLKDSIELNLLNTVSIIENFVNANLNVVVPYPISQKNYDFLANKLKGIEDKIYFITLNPSLAIALSNRGSRALDEWEKERIKYHHEIGINNPTFGVTIDTSKHTPVDTIQEIIKIIDSN